MIFTVIVFQMTQIEIYFFVLYSNLYCDSVIPVWYEVNNNNNNIEHVIIK